MNKFTKQNLIFKKRVIKCNDFLVEVTEKYPINKKIKNNNNRIDRCGIQCVQIVRLTIGISKTIRNTTSINQDKSCQISG